MAGTNTPIFPQTIKNWAAQIVHASASNTISIATGAANGTKIESLSLVNTDPSNAYNVQLVVTISSVVYVLAVIPVPAATGFSNAIPALAPLKSGFIPGLAFDSNGNPYLYLASGAVLGFSSQSTLPTGLVLQMFGQGGDF